MGKMRYTAEDLLRGTLIQEAGWYPLEVTGVREEAADSDGSANHIIEFKILDGTYKGVPVQRYFNEKAPGFAKEYYTACGQELSKTGGEFNFDLTKGKVLDAWIENRKDNKGNLQNNVARFRPHVAPSV